MSIEEIEYGSLASSSKLNKNFRQLAADIEELSRNNSANVASLTTTITSIQNALTTQLDAIKNELRPIGKPLIELVNRLGDDEVWLEGQTVSRTTYAKLFEVYGTTYGAGDGSNTFVLPDFRNRTVWGGGNSFGYIKAGLPNITASWHNSTEREGWEEPTGAVYRESLGGNGVDGKNGWFDRMRFNASRCNAIFGRSNTVQPPSVKVRVKTRYR